LADLKTLPLTVLLYEGPMARAYLARMAMEGFQPACILWMLLDKHPATKKKYPLWFPGGRWWAEKSQSLSLNHWARTLRVTQPRLCERILEGLAPLFPQAKETLDRMAGNLTPSEYTPETRKVLVSGVKDPRLASALNELTCKTLLFTGGGIVPKEVFAIPGIKILHVHPGHLPHVRGSDGVLWSVMERGCPGVSMFYMEAGLDTGDLIRATDLPLPQFNLKGLERPDDDTLYRALYAYYDPLLRAYFLGQALKDFHAISPDAWPSAPQNTKEGNTFRFMKAQQRQAALKILFPENL
jgi:hypothetical protein